MKLRGYRIELGEIESVLRLHPAVRDAAVVAGATGGEGESELVAYLVPRDGVTLAENDLRGYLSDKLPSCMVPAVFMSLPALPLTPNR